MGVRKRLVAGKPKWEVRWPENGRRPSRLFDRKADAERWDTEKRRERQLAGSLRVYDCGIRPKEETVGDYDQRLFTNPDHYDKYQQVQIEADRIRTAAAAGYQSPLQRFWSRLTKRGETTGS
jgi:hypothetical protein